MKYDQWFNDFIKRIYSQNQTIDQLMINQYPDTSPCLDVIGRKCQKQYDLLEISKELKSFKVPDIMCIPMTVPIKFVVQEAKIYHEVRNLFREMDFILEAP